MSEFLTRDGEETDDEDEDVDRDNGAAPAVVPEDLLAVVTPVGGIVQCGEFRWRRVKTIATDPRANHPEFDFTLRNVQLTEQTTLNDILWLCMPVSRAELLQTVRYRAGDLTDPVSLTLIRSLPNPFSNHKSYCSAAVNDKYKDWEAHHISAFLRCLFGGAQYRGGTELWATEWKGMVAPPDFGRVLSNDRFTRVLRYLARGPDGTENLKLTDPWAEVRWMVDGFNASRKVRLSLSPSPKP
jgi:hypothetical protein